MSYQKFDQYGNPIYVDQTQQFVVPPQTIMVPEQQGQYQTGYVQVPIKNVVLPQQVPQLVAHPIQQFNSNQPVLKIPQVPPLGLNEQFVNYSPNPVYTTSYINAPFQGDPVYATGQIKAPYSSKTNLEKKIACLQELFNQRIITADEYHQKKQELIIKKLKTF